MINLRNTSLLAKSATAFAFVVALGVSTPSYAMDSSFAAMSKSGTHMFYVWCTGKDDYAAEQAGDTAKTAQEALARESGKRCWPVWQGLKN